MPTDATLAERLELGELVHFPTCPFPRAEGDDLAFLLDQGLARGPHKNIAFDPATGELTGHRHRSDQQQARLGWLLKSFAETATRWLAGELPAYAASWTRDRATLRPEEEATRPLRHTARNDLLHVDNFPTRPSCGRRLLRLFVNLNPREPRVWVTSEPFAQLLQRFARRHRIPSHSVDEWCAPLTGLQRLLHGDWSGRPLYDAFMLRLHHALKSDEDFQETAPKRFWHFPPGSAWLLFSDGIAHADLRGQYALEHSFFVPQSALRFPDESPLAHLVRNGAATGYRRAG